MIANQIAIKVLLLTAALSLVDGCITQDGIMLGLPYNEDSSENDVEIRTNKCYGISLFWL